MAKPEVKFLRPPLLLTPQQQPFSFTVEAKPLRACGASRPLPPRPPHLLPLPLPAAPRTPSCSVSTHRLPCLGRSGPVLLLPVGLLPRALVYLSVFSLQSLFSQVSYKWDIEMKLPCIYTEICPKAK